MATIDFRPIILLTSFDGKELCGSPKVESPQPVLQLMAHPLTDDSRVEIAQYFEDGFQEKPHPEKIHSTVFRFLIELGVPLSYGDSEQSVMDWIISSSKEEDLPVIENLFRQRRPNTTQMVKAALHYVIDVERAIRICETMHHAGTDPNKQILFTHGESCVSANVFGHVVLGQRFGSYVGDSSSYNQLMTVLVGMTDLTRPFIKRETIWSVHCPSPHSAMRRSTPLSPNT
jgi:hypothetical protein